MPRTLSSESPPSSVSFASPASPTSSVSSSSSVSSVSSFAHTPRSQLRDLNDSLVFAGVYQCNWNRCINIYRTYDDLVDHLRSQHLNADEIERQNSFCWKPAPWNITSPTTVPASPPRICICILFAVSCKLGEAEIIRYVAARDAVSYTAYNNTAITTTRYADISVTSRPHPAALAQILPRVHIPILTCRIPIPTLPRSFACTQCPWFAKPEPESEPELQSSQERSQSAEESGSTEEVDGVKDETYVVVRTVLVTYEPKEEETDEDEFLYEHDELAAARQWAEGVLEAQGSDSGSDVQREEVEGDRIGGQQETDDEMEVDQEPALVDGPADSSGDEDEDESDKEDPDDQVPLPSGSRLPLQSRQDSASSSTSAFDVELQLTQDVGSPTVDEKANEAAFFDDVRPQSTMHFF
ncbi:hypothetical protein EW026_g6819 [Hermanssonia centrifuga]|uniref:C2H2-type domain-containing protein n=1 Tax=Hermanssonia centrifuga TaxID=98765 RepID=A0A4S4K9U8_9APHY|nr:hypothetical protein EW026_g6819 [Hermanssonia centrifuga]